MPTSSILMSSVNPTANLQSQAKRRSPRRRFFGIASTLGTLMMMVVGRQYAAQAFQRQPIAALSSSREAARATKPSSILSSNHPRDLSFRRLFASTSVDQESTSQDQTTEAASKVKPLPIKFSMDDVVSLCKRRGIIFPSSEIYNGYAGFYDYGPLGCEIKRNVKKLWWDEFVTRREDVVGIDSSIIHNPATWKSSGTLSV
jgi:hypothetical protein